jgi:hypothetical protein
MIGCVLTLRKIQIYALLVGMTLIVTAYVPGFSKSAEASKNDKIIKINLADIMTLISKKRTPSRYAALGLINLRMAYYHII